MKSKIIWIVVVVAVVGGYFALDKNEGSKDTTPIKIGANFGLSGNTAEYGEWARNALILALEKVNTENRRKTEVIFEDNRGQTSDAVSVYQKLKNVDRIDAVMTFISSIALAVEKSANQDEIIQMDISATTPDYSTPNDFSFRTGIVATQLAKESAQILSEKFGANNIALIYINNDFGKGMANVFKSSYTGSILAEEVFEQNGNDFRSQLTKIKSAGGLDYIFLVGHLRESGLLIKQANELGIKTPFFSDVYSVEGSDFIKAAGNAGENLIYLATKFDVNDQIPEVAYFVSAYKNKFGEDPTIFAAQAYDGFLALSTAYQNCQSGDNECAKQELMKLDFQGASGRIKFDENGDVVKNVELKQIKNGQFVKLEQ